MAKYELTKEHEAQLEPWANKWIDIIMSCKPMDDEDREITARAIQGLYEAADLKSPPRERIVFCKGPITMAFAGGFAAGIWHLKKNPDDLWSIIGEDKVSFEKKLEEQIRAEKPSASEEEILAAVDKAIRKIIDDLIQNATAMATRAATKSIYKEISSPKDA